VTACLFLTRLVCSVCRAPLVVASHAPHLADREDGDPVVCPNCGSETFWLVGRSAYCGCVAAGGQ
jgi:RNase P subunit RPR2